MRTTTCENILIYAVRYALQRIDFCVDEIIEYLIENWDTLDTDTQNAIVKDVIHYLDWDGIPTIQEIEKWQCFLEFAGQEIEECPSVGDEYIDECAEIIPRWVN